MLIMLHAVAVISFFVGCSLILSIRQASNQRLFSFYWWSLIGKAVLLIGAILLGRGAENGDAFGSRVAFFLTDPDEESDQKKWETEVAMVAIRLAGIQSGDQTV